MSDPLSISAGVAGIISLGLEVTKGLMYYYEAWKGSKDAIATLFESLEALSKTLSLLREKIAASPFISKDSADHFAENVASCARAIQRLENELKKAQAKKPGLTAMMRRCQYPFREKR